MTRGVWIVAAGALALAVAAVIMLLALSGGDDSTSQGSEFGPLPGTAGAVPQELQDCLAQQGVEPQTGSPSEPSAEDRQAFDACSEYLPEPPSGAEPPVPPGLGG